MALNANLIKDIYSKSNKPIYFLSELGEIILDEFASIRLIGEIERPEGRSTFTSLKDALKSVLGQFERFPISFFETEHGRSRAVLSLYFVWTGIFYYGEEQGNELWPHIFHGLGHTNDPNLSWRCGQIFMECLKENNLETFDQVKTGLIYISRILLHGLIPEGQIDKFIREFIFEALSQPSGLYKSGHTLIEYWITRKYNVPKPIERFLQYGNPVNVELVDRFLEMARNWEDDDPETWWQWGLPKYMFDAFQRCINTVYSPISKKIKKSRIGERPFLIFDYARGNQPIIILPPQRLENENEIRISYKDLKNTRTEIIETKPIDSTLSWKGQSHYSELQELHIGPSDIWEINIGGNKQRAFYNFPESKTGNRIPFYIFNSNTGKALRFNSDRGISEEIIILYFKDASLEISGGSFLSEPMDLLGKWVGWQGVFCSLDERGSLFYDGPDASFQGRIKENISFRRFDGEADQPILKSEYKAPYWLRCNDDILVILRPNGLSLFLPDQVYRLWRRGVGRMRRLDSPAEKVQNIPFRLSDAGKAENGQVIGIPGIENIEPGVYEIYLRGAIGIEDLIFPFVYLPIIHCQRNISVETTSIAQDFYLKFSKMVPFLPFENTEVSIESEDYKVRVFLKEDRADAFCALKVFNDTVRSVILLLERSDIRWVRHSESGPIEWRYWRSRPEVIPLQRIEEVRDSRTLIEMNPDLLSTSALRPKMTAAGKLRILLDGIQSEKSDKTSLMSHEASRFKRRYRAIWVIDLKQFSDQMKDLRSYQSADISIECGNGGQNLSLFTLLRYPEYKNFTVQSLEVDHRSEKIRINWDWHLNEPQKKRIVKISATDHPEMIFAKPIPDGQKPPITLMLEPVEKPESWIAQIEIVESRFQISRFGQMSMTPQARWMRIPSNWYDWLDWNILSSSEYHECLDQNECISNNINLKFMPWSHFLNVFYHKKGDNTCQELKRLLGTSFIENAIPFSKGTQWEVKRDYKRCLTLQIRSSSIDLSKEGFRCFENCCPSEWCYLPKGIEIELLMDRAHKYLGAAGTVWKLFHQGENQNPIFISDSDGILEIDYWLEDAVDKGNTGSIQARLPINELWDNPVYFPVLKALEQKNYIFIWDDTGSKSESVFSKFEYLLADEKTKIEADDLVNRWDKWSLNSEVNPLIRRFIRGRLETSKENALSGGLAFIARLKASGFENSILKHPFRESSYYKNSEALFKRTFEFVKKFLPQGLLRDLIISEVIINWYWNKTLYSI